MYLSFLGLQSSDSSDEHEHHASNIVENTIQTIPETEETQYENGQVIPFSEGKYHEYEIIKITYHFKINVCFV